MVTYEEQILEQELPGSIVIAGAGAIGVEFAYVLHNYGVKVTIVEFLDRMVPLEDAEVSKELQRRYRKLGIDVLTGDPGRVDRRVGRRRARDGVEERPAAGPRGGQGVAGHRFPAAGRGLRAGEGRASS